MKPRRIERKEKERKGKKEQNTEPKKSTGRDVGLINSEQNEHLERKRKKFPGSGTMEFQSK
jgi:hypothetical protein